MLLSLPARVAYSALVASVAYTTLLPCAATIAVHDGDLPIIPPVVFVLLFDLPLQIYIDTYNNLLYVKLPNIFCVFTIYVRNNFVIL